MYNIFVLSEVLTYRFLKRELNLSGLPVNIHIMSIIPKMFLAYFR